MTLAELAPKPTNLLSVSIENEAAFSNLIPSTNESFADLYQSKSAFNHSLEPSVKESDLYSK